MLQTAKSPPVAAREPDSAAEFYTDLVRFIRRQLPLILGIAFVSLALGVVYVLNAPPMYTAQASMIIDTRKVNLFQQPSLIGDTQVDSAAVESQVEILRSENIALAVIRDLRLADDPEFVGPGGGLIGSLINAASQWFGSQPPRSEFELRRRAAETFASRLAVRRVGLTYIIDVSFRSYDPARAAQIANTVADAYIVDQLDAKYKATQRAGVWLQDRIRELRDQASMAERAVVNFKSRYNIVDAGGRLMNEQQLAEISSQLVVARGQVTETRARLDRIENIIKTEIPDATVTDTLRSEVITKLRQQYLDLKNREADWSSRYGSNHLAALHLRNQMAEIRRSILDELRRFAETYKSDYAIARQREASLQKELAGVVTDSQATNQAQVALRELESSAQTYRALYDNFLQRYMESVQQQTFPITEARVITAASPPLTKSHPKTTLILILSGALGVMLGLGAGRLRDLSDRAFRTPGQVESILNTNCVSVLPVLAKPSRTAAELGRPGERVVSRKAALFWEVVNAPFSRYAEAIRAVKVVTDLSSANKASKIIGVTSTLPNEGKSTVAASLAQLIAQSGAKVLLVDADLRNPSLTRRLAPHTTKGLIELVAGTTTFEEVRWSDPETGLHFLPAVLKARIAHTNEILASEVTRRLFERLRESYDYIIVDLSPVAPVVDVRTTAHLVDSYLFVIEWGKTKVDAVERAFSEAPAVFQNLIGVVLNKANISVLSRYEAYKSNYYYNRYYSRYNYTG